MSGNAVSPWESVLVRHQLGAKHGKLDSIESMLHASFESNGSLSSTGNTVLETLHASGRWCAAGQVKGNSWVSLNSNVGTAKDLFEANSKGRRTEVVWAGKEPNDGEVVFYWFIARKPQLILRGLRSDDTQSWRKELRCTSPELKKSLLACDSIVAAFEKACAHVKVKIPSPHIAEQNGKYVWIGASGKPVATGLNGFKIMTASGLAPQASSASVLLAAAIEKGNVAKVRKAIAAGASLEALPETSLTPLLAALLNCEESDNWQKCAQALVDAGCSVDGSERNRPLHDVCEHYIDEEMSIKLAEFLLSNGADVNSRDSNGLTVLDKAACYDRAQLLEFLMGHGADPHLPTRGDKSIVDEIRSRYEKDLEYSHSSRYKRALELLTGSTIESPHPIALSPADQKEAQRFQAIAKGEMLLKMMPDAANIKRIKVSRLLKFNNYKAWAAELTGLGFEEAAHCIVTLFGPNIYSAFVHPKLGFDALLSDDGPLGDGTLRLEMVAYHDSSNISMVTNKPVTEDPDLSLSLVTRKVKAGATPTQLLKELKSLVKSRPLQDLTVASFVDRFTETYDALLADFRRAANKLRDNPIRMPDGTLPRFERQGVYIKVHLQDELRQCGSLSIVESAKKTLERTRSRLGEAEGSPACYWLRDIVHEAARLAAVNHFQMAAADTDISFYPPAIDAAIALLETTAAAKKTVADSWSVDTLAYGLTFALHMQNWEAAKQMSAGIGADFANPKYRFEEGPPVAVAQWQVLLTNRFRSRSCPKSKQFREEILAGRSKHAKALLAATDALDAKDSDGFYRVLQESIRIVDSQRARSIGQFDVYNNIAWNESILWMLARRQGLQGNLPPQHQDFLIEWHVAR